jgi:hypothetical protein
VDLKLVIEEFQDYLAPTLDVYEQAVYLYIFRHSRLLGQSETTIGFKSARLKIALGKGQEGARMAENTCYEKLRSLEAKGCLRVLGTERGGTRIRLNLPSEIPNLIPPAQHAAAITLEEMDFFSVPAHHLAIFQREHGKCFYCLRGLEKTGSDSHGESTPCPADQVRAEPRTGADANSVRSVRREAAWKNVETPWVYRHPMSPWG